MAFRTCSTARVHVEATHLARFCVGGGHLRISSGRPQDKNRNSDCRREAARAERSKRRDRLGGDVSEWGGPGATLAAERPEPTVGGLSERGRQHGFSAKREFVPSAGVVAEVGGKIPAKRDFCGGECSMKKPPHTAVGAEIQLSTLFFGEQLRVCFSKNAFC